MFMFFLEKLGLSRKKKVLVPFTTDKLKKDTAPGFFNKNNIFKLLLSLFFLSLIIAFFPKFAIYETAYNMGEPWREDDLSAPFTFSLLKTDAELQNEIEEIHNHTNQIFLFDQHAQMRVFNKLDHLFGDLYKVLEAYAQWQIALDSAPQKATSDSLNYQREKSRLDIGIDVHYWKPLARYYANQRMGSISDQVLIDNKIQNELENVIRELFNRGIINISKEEIEREEITVRNQRDHTERDLLLQNVHTLREGRVQAHNRINERIEEDFIPFSRQIIHQVLEPNLIFNEEETNRRIQENIEAISPVRGAINEGQVIIRRGDIITPERHNILVSLDKARADRASDIERWKQYVGQTLLVIAVFLIFFFYIFLYRRHVFDQNMMLFLVFIIISLVYGIGAFTARIDELSPYIVPFAIAPILLTIVFDSRLGLMTTTFLALVGGLMYGNSFEFVIATMTGCSIGVYSVRDIKNRSQLYLITPALIFFSYTLVLLAFTLTKVGGWDIFINNLLFLFVNAVGIWLTYPLVLLVEKTFGITTDITLLELSDTNQPILKRLMLEAPGSFHHSLQVANLSESAAVAIGANSLLCRAGAMYHDIGKLEKPQYFVENQHSENAHDKLKPRMSALVIKNHVDTGIKMARDIELPEVIVDFIKTHHGTSLIRFFYEKALNEAGNEQEIQEEDFRYDGPIPESKETGILMLADGIEAASRAMKDQTYQKLENLVNRMIDDRLGEGQLNNCSLTLKDLKIIKTVFTNTLQGIYHGRVKYPGQSDKNQ